MTSDSLTLSWDKSEYVVPVEAISLTRIRFLCLGLNLHDLTGMTWVNDTIAPGCTTIHFLQHKGIVTTQKVPSGATLVQDR